MKRCGGLPDGWKDAVERLTGERAINGEVATIRREDFRAWREIGKGTDAGIRKVRLEIGEFFQPEQQVSRVECYVEFGAQVTVHKHFQKRFSGSDEVSGLGQNRSAREQGHIQREGPRPAVVEVILVKVGDQKSRVSDLRHDASPKARELSSPFQSTDRWGAPSREDTSRDSRSAPSRQAHVDEAGWRAGQARLVAPQAAGPSRHLRSRQECSWPDANPRAEAGQERSAESDVPPKPPRRRMGKVVVGGRASRGLRGGVSPSPQAGQRGARQARGQTVRK